ncbi:MAG: MATE family efflux transporter [Chloroflexota bacterium]
MHQSTTAFNYIQTLKPLPLLDNRTLLRKIFKLALPVMLTNLLQSLVGVIDTFMIGRLGELEIAAAGMSNLVRILFLIMVLAVSAGSMSLIAQAKGARDPKRMSLVARQSVSAGLLLSLVLMVLGLLLAQPILQFTNSGGDPRAIELGTAFLQIIFLGMPFLVLNIVFNRLMQGAGDTVTPLWITTGINFLNILFNYAFIFGFAFIPAYGLVGAAMGTVLSRALGVGLAFLVVLSGRNIISFGKGSYLPDWQMFRDIFGIGLPSGIQGIFRNGGRLLVMSIVTSTTAGSIGAAALTIGISVESIAFMPVLGINVAATNLVGEALGKWQVAQARRRGSFAIYLGVAVMAILLFPLVLFAPQIVRLFSPEASETLIEAGTTYLRISTPFLLGTAVAMVGNGALRGAGDTTPGMYSTMLTRGALSVVLAWVFAFPLGMDLLGVWIGLAIGLLLDGVYLGWRWRSNVWEQVAIARTDLYRKHLGQFSAETRADYLETIRTPLMAQPKTTEIVTENSVIYKLPDQDIVVDIEDGGYLFGRSA